MQHERVLAVPHIGDCGLTLDVSGSGPTCLLLHPGAGPTPMLVFAKCLVANGYQAIVPTHPGFDGTARPSHLRNVGQLGALYAALLDDLQTDDVVVIGNSLGGWIAVELGLASRRWIGRLVIVNSVGFDDPANPEADTRDMSPAALARLAFHDPQPVLDAQASAGPEEQAMMKANQDVLFSYAPQMEDPTLTSRLDGLAGLTVQLLWGESDGVVTPAAGRSFADAIPGATFQLLPGTGHMPELETPELLFEAVFS